MAERKRLGLYSLSFLRQPNLRRLLLQSGFEAKAGPLSRDLDGVAVWGNSAAATRGRKAADQRGLPLVSLEEPFLCGVTPEDNAPIGLLLDKQALYYDSSQPSDLEDLLQGQEVASTALKKRAKDGLKLLKLLKLSKYNHWWNEALPEPGFVLVIDQLRGDSAIDLGGADADSFERMLRTAKENHPTLPILIRKHPKSENGHFASHHLDERTKFLADGLNPWDVLERAEYVYTVTSQMGMEAIFAGHRPHVFGAPFYAGWGLSHDRVTVPRRTRTRTAEQLFAATHLLYPIWYDPSRNKLTDFETAARQLARQAEHWRTNSKAAICAGMRKWKHKHIAAFLRGPSEPPVFVSDPEMALSQAAQEGRRLLVWANAVTPELLERADERGVGILRVEDGFLRSKGLGANLHAPRSLVFDDLGIYYDPNRPSRLEELISGAASLSGPKRTRVQALIANLRAQGVTKYNQGASMPAIPPRQDRDVILVPGQVEDDASVRLGCKDVASNLDLIRAARDANPNAYIIYKPHPDVEAGLRPGAVADLPDGLVDLVAHGANPADAIALADEIWTMTSLLGFEALLRGKKVVTLGAPFYAGWGLTEDRGAPVYRRKAKPSLESLVHATLIDYPTYIDPQSGRISSVEATLEALAETGPSPMPLLGRAQRLGRKYSWLWR